MRYAGQPVGLVVAKDRDTAVRAAKLVTVEYEDVKKPVLNIREAIQSGRLEVNIDPVTGKPVETQKFGNPEGQ